MASKTNKKTKKKKRARKTAQKAIEIYKHKEKRKNNPPVGIVTSKKDSPKVQIKKYQYDPGINPQLQWAGKAERLSFDVPTVSLHVHERIDPRSIIETVRAQNSVDYEQMSLFHDPKNKISPDKEAEFYKHEKLWANRMITGDSLLVMNSLLEKEGMGGKIQCIYIDPPYGKAYGSNFQPFTNKRDVKDKSDRHLNVELETIKAFRDTWELGIHSYLTYMRDRLLLARELLTESGSCFVQISDENIHHIRELMDEIFGAQNFVRLITFSKTGSMVSGELGRTSDYLIWFAKDKRNIKYRQLFHKKNPDSFYNNVELADGTVRKIEQAEKVDPSLLPKGAKVFRLVSLESAGSSKDDTPFEFEGEVFRPNKNSHWKLSYPDGMDRLKSTGRIIKSGNKLRWKYYIDDYPLKVISEVWGDTSGFNAEQRYVVETRPKVIERCLLMTTDPGDIVLDPTCGSGTTAYVAEQWGRRWLTFDTSRVAITLAKQRLMTSYFDYYKMKNKKEGISSGFDYNTKPHRTLSSIANNELISEEILYDQPKVDNSKIRITGPFTVEAVPAHRVESLSDIEQESFLKKDWFEKLKTDGIKASKGVSKNIEFSRLELISDTEYIYAEGETKETQPKRVIICFGSEYTPLEQRQVEEALKEAKPFSPHLVIFCAFQFDPEAGKNVDHLDLKWAKVLKVQMNSDLFTSDLKKSKGESFWLIGQPDISTPPKNNNGKYTVEVKGFDYYNTDTNTLEKGGKEKIAMWMLDTNYDGKSVYPRQVFFPISSPKHDWTKLKKTLGTEIDENLINKFSGTQSVPFELGNKKKIAVKVIDNRGIESLVVKALE